MDKALTLAKYINNCDKASLLAQQIQELDVGIEKTEKALEIVEGLAKIEATLLKDLHNLRVARLGLELRLNKLEHDILEFELGEELRD